MAAEHIMRLFSMKGRICEAKESGGAVDRGSEEHIRISPDVHQHGKCIAPFRDPPQSRGSPVASTGGDEGNLNHSRANQDSYR